MQLKIFLTSLPLLTLLFYAEILSHINLYIWDIISNTTSYSEHYYYRKKLITLFTTIEKIRTASYVAFFVFLIVTAIIYICF
jgi:hypothetical protein